MVIESRSKEPRTKNKEQGLNRSLLFLHSGLLCYQVQELLSCLFAVEGSGEIGGDGQ